MAIWEGKGGGIGGKFENMLNSANKSVFLVNWLGAGPVRV
jgi:hypothetical protein